MSIDFSVPTSAIDIGYPPWDATFDPHGRPYLLVGGGGGAGQKEVPNKLTLLDVSEPRRIEKVADIDVTDDSPASIGALPTANGLKAIVGVNKGDGKHLRTVDVNFPAKTKGVLQSQGSGKALGDFGLFGQGYASSKDAFQRVLRLSTPRTPKLGSKTLGIMASSFATPSEVVVYDATNGKPTEKDILHRIVLPEKVEANDVDVWEAADGEFWMAYVTKLATYFGAVKAGKPILQHTHLNTDYRNRSIRILNKEYALILVNCGANSQLQVLKFYPEGNADIILRMSLVSKFARAVSMDAVLLDASQDTGSSQAIIAVAAQTHDVNVVTMDMPGPGRGPPRSFLGYENFKFIHGAPLKKVVFAPFFSPYETADGTIPKKVPQQYVRLASISLSNRVVVQSIPVASYSTKSRPRYYLKKSPAYLQILMFLTMCILAIAWVVQVGLDEMADQGTIARIHLLPASMRFYIQESRRDNDPIKNMIKEASDGHIHLPGVKSISDLLHLHGKQEERKAIVLAPGTGASGDLHTEVHSDHESIVQDPNAKSWDELTEHEQALWKKRLSQAGSWSANEGETILKSIFFSEIAGAVGRAVLGG
jgi:prolactin regulatory element-binding protein